MQKSFLRGQKYLWQFPELKSDKKIIEHSALYNLSPAVVQTLHGRGFIDKKSIDLFLLSSFEDSVVHASVLKDAEKSVQRILQAIEKKEKILIFGDYDVDGITASSLVLMSLLPLGANINFYLPNRVKDGYGLSSKIVKRAADNNYSLIITVDNGITANEAVNCANERGIDVIITDHHKAHDNLPKAYAIVNPNQPECLYPHKNLAGVGVIFKVISLLYEHKKKSLPEKVYELLLLGTVADVVPLIGENRYWVRYGLSCINKKISYALEVLKVNGRLVKPLITSTDIGFSIAPQINALGRLDDPRDGVKFLIGTDKKEISRIGNVLYELNEARKEIERAIFAQIQEKIESNVIDLEKENIIMAASKDWPAGVIGLVASRLVSTYGKPVFLFHITKNGLAKGSCRSVAALDVFNMLNTQKDMLNSFGGHAQAAGLSLPVDKVAVLKNNLEKLLLEQVKPEDLIQKIVIDAPLPLDELNEKFMKDLRHLEPFGHHNREPLFCIENAFLTQKPTLLKDVHTKCLMRAQGALKSVIFFNRPDIFELLIENPEASFFIAAQASENHWRNKVSIELMGIDIALQPAGD